MADLEKRVEALEKFMAKLVYDIESVGYEAKQLVKAVTGYRPATSPDVAQWAEEARKEQDDEIKAWKAANIQYSGEPKTSHDPHETNLA